MDWSGFFSSFLGVLGAIPILGFLEKLSLQERQAKNNILQEEYKIFFSSKMNAYMELVHLRYKYSIISLENQSRPDDFLDRLNLKKFSMIFQIKSHIQENRIYLSKDLVDIFDKWYSLIMPIYQEVDNVIYSEFDRIGQEAEHLDEKDCDLANIELADSFMEEISKNPKIEECWNILLGKIDTDFIALKNKYDL
ncbi:hypothetical protein [Moraxella lincolnii]|uniref:Uncharacterized protein n=1 Tax=Lwoffella lincolnii TaxID=90241 RepID=A0A1T0CCZ9_9GAMM|nr:hypothetical protein [Moraxella lincolnii]OOS20204.1 hypothetical protein B0682_07325 [Moraxella lincolnii]